MGRCEPGQGRNPAAISSQLFVRGLSPVAGISGRENEPPRPANTSDPAYSSDFRRRDFEAEGSNPMVSEGLPGITDEDAAGSVDGRNANTSLSRGDIGPRLLPNW